MDLEDLFIFIPNQDQIGYDSHFMKDAKVEEMMEYVFKNPAHVAFNTIGYFKNDINNITHSKYLTGANQGIYILKKAVFTFLPGLDQFGYDIQKIDNKNYDKLMEYALLDNSCVAFNTSGYMKSKIDNLQNNKNIYGIYIKNKYIKTDVYSNKFPKDEFVFFPKKDQLYFDIAHDNLSIPDKMTKALNNEKIIAFNTKGYYKENIENIKENPYFSESDGLFVKKSYLSKHTIEKLFIKDKKILNNIFIETGSFIGDGIQAALNIGFNEIHSIELAEKYYNICKERFKDYPNVHLHLGDSGVYLAELLQNIDSGVTFWLDGHFSTLDTACADNYVSPIQEELEIIKKYNHNDHVILIDDMDSFDERIIQFNESKYNKCGYITKNDLEKKLSEIQENNTQYYFGPACVSYKK